MKRNERIEIFFYMTGSGKEPVREFFLELSDDKDIKLAIKRLKEIQNEKE